MGALRAARPGRKNENHMAYSMANHRVNKILTNVVVGQLSLYASNFRPQTIQGDHGASSCSGSGSSSASNTTMKSPLARVRP